MKPATHIQTTITEQAAAFIESARFQDIPQEALHIARRCIIDGVGLFFAGTDEESIGILTDAVKDQGGRGDATLLGQWDTKVPASLAARVLGTAGHAHDWDDTQVSHDPAHVYGLLTHPTIPPLSAAMVMAEKTGGLSGEDFLTAFLVGFEVECKISEWTLPTLYKNGFHSSGVVGTFGACVTAARILGLRDERLRHALGIAASLAAGIRANFGTMTKPFHVGRAAENGVIAAELAARGFTADPESLDGRWGFSSVFAGGVSPEKLGQGFGRTWTIVDPGVSIKPYPSGILTHQSMDLMLDLVRDNDIAPETIESIAFHAGSNILNPIRYPFAANHLQAKFSMAALLSMIAINRQAGRLEFTDAFVQSSAMAEMQKRVTTHLDDDIEAMGFDRIRSRIEITLKSGDRVAGWADERYRGGPAKPMTDRQVEEKFLSCVAGLVDDAKARRIMDTIWQTGAGTSSNDLLAAMKA
ncbi:MmgE/PrpD family protein [Fodinicurvata sp. EGI_FJ10296]|uniref:MmgE/PrpD family protein n=1 Tax=Fodinicurvata sp. EGI_FJ10296 TaxID=3231908 RepID=UPI003455478F